MVFVSGSRAWVLGLRPRERHLVEIDIPGQVVIHHEDRGQIQVRALHEIALLEQSPKIFSLPGTDLLRIPVDASIDLTPLDLESMRAFGFQFISIKRWMNIPELMRLHWFIRSVRERDDIRIDFSKLPVVREKVDPGGSVLLEVDPELLSPLVSGWFEILEFREANLSVAVLSNGRKQGKGLMIARQLEHVGLRVISVANKEMKTGIYVRTPKLRNNIVAVRLAKWFSAPLIVSDFDERADILVVQ